VRFCAFSFPAVLLTLGRDKWSALQGVYSTLTQDLQWKVRRTLSHSLHEVAKILGTELTEEHLLSTFNLFLKDLDQVRVGVIRHLSSFLEVLSPLRRAEYIESIRDIQLNSANWRFRKLLAKQLGRLARLYETQTVSEAIIPMTIQLCEDPVITVRYAVTAEVRSRDEIVHLLLMWPQGGHLPQTSQRHNPRRCNPVCGGHPSFWLSTVLLRSTDVRSFPTFF
jgi:serine/threonine-protein phosphatase 4 regulatory subunit 1